MKAAVGVAGGGRAHIPDIIRYDMGAWLGLWTYTTTRSTRMQQCVLLFTFDLICHANILIHFSTAGGNVFITCYYTASLETAQHRSLVPSEKNWLHPFVLMLNYSVAIQEIGKIWYCCGGTQTALLSQLLRESFLASVRRVSYRKHAIERRSEDAAVIYYDRDRDGAIAEECERKADLSVCLFCPSASCNVSSPPHCWAANDSFGLQPGRINSPVNHFNATQIQYYDSSAASSSTSESFSSLKRRLDVSPCPPLTKATLDI